MVRWMHSWVAKQYDQPPGDAPTSSAKRRLEKRSSNRERERERDEKKLTGGIFTGFFMVNTWKWGASRVRYGTYPVLGGVGPGMVRSWMRSWGFLCLRETVTVTYKDL